SKMLGNGDTVHLGKAAVDADIAEMAIEKAEACGRAVIDGLELRKTLSGQRLQTRDSRVVIGRCGRFGLWPRCNERGYLLCRHGPSVKPALAKLTAKAQQHVRLLRRLDTFGHRRQSETVSQSDDCGYDLAALAR